MTLYRTDDVLPPSLRPQYELHVAASPDTPFAFIDALDVVRISEFSKFYTALDANCEWQKQPYVWTHQQNFDGPYCQYRYKLVAKIGEWGVRIDRDREVVTTSQRTMSCRTLYSPPKNDKQFEGDAKFAVCYSFKA